MLTSKQFTVHIEGTHSVHIPDAIGDAFAKAGSGTGRTFVFDFLPLRIDFILSDPIFKVLDFENYDIALSDHYPIMAELAIDTKE